MKTDSIYQEWASSIDLANTRVTKLPSFIFLCGGPISRNGHDFGSCRHIFYSHIKESARPFRDDVLLAEEVFNYFEHSAAYQDLLRFERHLAELSALVVIFLESPGSIAEFGSFATLEPVREKLLIVIHEEHTDKESFIWRGPVLHIKSIAKEKARSDPVSVYKWRNKCGQDDRLTKADFCDVTDLAETMEEILSTYPKTQSFQSNQLGHIMLLILDLLKIIQLATQEEILSCLNFLGIPKQRPQTVEQYLTLLRSLKLVIKKTYGHNVYYLSSPHSPWLNWAYQKSAKVRDVQLWKTHFIQYYYQNIPHKHRALQAYWKATGLIGD